MDAGKPLSHIGHRVKFGRPKDVKVGGANEGTIIDEVWADPNVFERPPHPQPCPHGSSCWGEHACCSQLIEWNDGGKDIRLAYYRRSCGKDTWKFAAQYTVTAEPPMIKALFERTLAKDAWFRKDTAC